MRQLIDILLNSIIPNTCLVCERHLNSDEKFCQWCLPETYAKNADLFCQACFSAMGQNQKRQICPACIDRPLPYRQIRFLWNYDFEARRYINKMKYSNSIELCKFAGELLAQSFSTFYAEFHYDLILPMPSSKISASKRLYYPCCILARKVKLNLQNCKISYSCLQLKSNHIPQALLNNKERLKNAKNSFLVKDADVKGKSILLVEDVVTTGATIHEASMALLNAGALSVDILALSRVARWHRLNCENINQLAS